MDEPKTDISHEENLNSHEKCEEKIAELNTKVSEMEGNWKRALADYKNLVDRTNKERNQFVDFANEVILSKFLSVYDSLEMLGRYNQDQGLALTIKQFGQVLKESGLEEIEALGKDYSLESMEAIEMVEGEKDKVTEVITKGFYLKSKLLRPARVKVGKGN
jgi:molecular chaperone GrpE